MHTSAAPPRMCRSCGMPEHGRVACSAAGTPTVILFQEAPPTEAQLREAFEEVLRHRHFLAGEKETLSRLQDAFNAENEALLERVLDGRNEVALAENFARALAIAAYEADPEQKKDVLPGCLGIREVKVVEYDAKEALVWAMDHQLALWLDVTAYKLLVQGGLAPGTVSTKVTATIHSGA